MATTNSLPIQNVVNITIATPPAGLAAYKVNNLLYVTKETPQVSITQDYRIYLTPTQVGDDYGLSSEAYSAALNIFGQPQTILTGGGALIIAKMDVGDTLSTMYAKISPQIFFGGMIFGGYQPNDAEMTAAAAVFQANGILLGLASNDLAELNAGGAFFTIQAAKQTFARCCLYTVNALAARLFLAARFSLGMSTAWDGSATASTGWLKDLANVLPDPGISQSILALCQTVGVDVFANIAGLPKLFSTGGNTFMDQVWGILWLRSALQVAGFNCLAQTSTKIPQTEPGVALLRGAYIDVLEQGVRNGFIAPGAWNSPDLFGNPEDLKAAVANLGYYVYSLPVSLQSQVDRADRKAPLIQIAVKLAGAIHTTSVIVFINP